MHSKEKQFSNFCNALNTTSICFRPDNEWQLNDVFEGNTEGLLVRGNGLSYSDCCLLDKGTIIDTSRLNHLLSFDASSGIVICQGAVTFADLFFNPRYIPPVLPGTLRATIAGGVANDVHGKNNPKLGSLGHHIEWLELQIGNQTFHCSRQENESLFYATIAGVGLTGIIKRVALRLHKATHFVSQTIEKHANFEHLFKRMKTEGLQHDYQVAWLDLLNAPRALLSFADHCETNLHHHKRKSSHTIPTIPLRVINPWIIKQFNRLYYHQANEKPRVLPLWTFNNPLDSIKHWNRLYGKQGLLQFQAVFDEDNASALLQSLCSLIQNQHASPTLAVLKYFTKPGLGWLSFVKPGFTLAIDFINNNEARLAIKAMNQVIVDAGGRIYLAKDLLLEQAQFNSMYTHHEKFQELLARYNSPMRSDLGRRLGITS